MVKSICLSMQKIQETRVQSLCLEDLLEEEMAIHSSMVAWEIPWIEELGRLQPMGLQRVNKTEQLSKNKGPP